MPKKYADYVYIRRSETRPMDGAMKKVYVKSLVQVGTTTLSIPYENYLFLGKGVTWVTLLVRGGDVLLYPCGLSENGARKISTRADRERASIKLKPHEQRQLLCGHYKALKGYDDEAGLKHLVIPGAYIERT